MLALQAQSFSTNQMPINLVRFGLQSTNGQGRARNHHLRGKPVCFRLREIHNAQHTLRYWKKIANHYSRYLNPSTLPAATAKIRLDNFVGAIGQCKPGINGQSY